MGVQYVSSGIMSDGVVLGQWDELKVLSGGAAEATLVTNESNLYVAQGAAVSDTAIASGGGVFVIGVASGTVINGGFEYVQGGTASGTRVYAGGTEWVGAGGLAASSTLTSGGVEILAGGTADAVVVSAGAVQFVSAYGFASGTVVESGGFQEVLSAGVASGTMVQSGGTLVVLPGGVVSSAMIAPGGNVVSTGIVVNPAGGGVVLYAGAASGLNIGAAATAYVISGGTLVAAMVSSGGRDFIDSGGVASGTSLLAGGAETVSGGVAYTTVISGQDATAHSFQNVTGSGIASGTVVEAGGAQNVSAGTAYATVLNQGAQFVEDAVVSATVINGGGYQYIGGGGVAVATEVKGGSENVSGGVAYDTVVGSGGHVAAGFGGALSAMVLSGGTAFLGPDGTAVAAVISSGGVLTLAGGTATGTVVSFGGGVIISGNPTYGAAVSEDFGTVISAGGSELVETKGIVSGVTIAGGALGFLSGGTASGHILFDGAGSLFIDQAQMPAAVISGFAPGDMIELAAVPFAAGDTLSVTSNTVTISAGGTVAQFQFGDTARGVFTLGAAADGALVLGENPPCFTAGTLILTPRGQIPVERLRVGETVITASGEDAEITWIGRRRLNILRHKMPEQVRPVRIAANALGEGVPARDLMLSPDHALFLEHVLIPAKALINDRNVKQVAVSAVTYFHIELPAHAVMFAEHCAVESYLDTGNRGGFENAAGPITLHPDFGQARREAESCARLVETGPEVDAVSHLLLQRFHANIERPRPLKRGVAGW
jgi:autotransporter passenger strand-loop-strand repeat protein